MPLFHVASNHGQMGLDMQRKLTSPVMNRSRKIRGHRRQMSDPKIHPPFSPIKEDGDSETDYDRGFMGFLHPSLKPPYKAYEYECIDDMGRRAEWDPSQSYLAFSYAAAGGALRETAINSVLDDDRYLSSSRYSLRRSSDGLGGIDTRRRHDSRKHRKPRSWHPSPYGSDDDDDQLTREEKKAKIKAEIARRRQQIEENARLHEELLRLARLRESAELGFTPHPTQDLGRSGGYGTSSVLKSIDEILLSGRGGSGLHLDYRGHSPRRTEEDRSMDRIASTFRTDDYTSGVYERLSDFSPLTDFTPHAMPLLPDMPTRSRKLLEDLGSSPITESVLAIPQKGKQRYYDKMKQNSLQPFTYDSRSNQESSRRSQTIQHVTQSQEEKQKEERNKGAQDIAQQTTSNTVHHVRRLLLKRDPNDRSVGGNGLGMRVIGGKEIPNSGGKLGTYVTRIYQGGVADKLGVIKEGDRLLEWNGVSLTGKTFEEVQRVVSLSEGKIDIVVESGKPSTSLELSCTSLKSLDKSNYDKIDYNGNKRMLSFEETLNEKHSDEIKKHIRDCGIRTSSSEEREEFEAQTLDTAELHKGEIQLQVCYDKNAQILYVIVKKARNLKCVEGVPPDSLVNVYLLPERINEQQRRTQVLTRTCDPEWNETLVYENVSQDQLISQFLELTVWNYAESTTIKFLGGILIDLTDPNVVTEEARWYALQDGPTLQKSMSNSGSVNIKVKNVCEIVPVCPTAIIQGNHLGFQGCRGAICSIL